MSNPAMESRVLEALAQRLRWARNEGAATQMSQRQVARAIGVGQPRIAEWEGAKRTPQPEALKRLAQCYGLSLTELLPVEYLEAHPGILNGSQDSTPAAYSPAPRKRRRRPKAQVGKGASKKSEEPQSPDPRKERPLAEMGERITQLRLEKAEKEGRSLERKELAREAEFPYNSYWAWEVGRNAPSGHYLEQLAFYFDVAPEYILGETETRGEYKEPLERVGEKVGERIAAARTQAGLERGETVTQAAFAEACGVSASTVKAWEAGETAPTKEQAQRIAEALEISFERIFGAPSPAESAELPRAKSRGTVELPKANPSTLGERIRALRWGAVQSASPQMSREELAQKARVAERTLGTWERDAAVPRGGKLRRLARALGVSPEYLRTGRGR